MDFEPNLELGHKLAMERRRKRLLRSVGLDNSTKQQSEIDLDFTYWRADRWGVFGRWKPRVARELCPGSNPWVPHQLYPALPTYCMARNACQRLRRSFPGKQYRFQPVRWTDAHGNRFPPST